MKLIQTQEQKLQQVQRLSQQQMLQVHMLEMPLTELEQNIQAEIDDNPAMESGGGEAGLEAGDGFDSPDFSDHSEMSDSSDWTENSDSSELSEKEKSDTALEDRRSALDEALSRIGMDDRMPEAETSSFYGGNTDNADYEEMVYGEQASFYDKLKEQMVDVDLDDRQREIMEYVIGSLDGDGLLRKSADSISDELAIYHNIYCTEEDVKNTVSSLSPADADASLPADGASLVANAEVSADSISESPANAASSGEELSMAGLSSISACMLCSSSVSGISSIFTASICC